MALTPEEQQMLVTQQLQKVMEEVSANTDIPLTAWALSHKYVRAFNQNTTA